MRRAALPLILLWAAAAGYCRGPICLDIGDHAGPIMFGFQEVERALWDRGEVPALRPLRPGEAPGAYGVVAGVAGAPQCGELPRAARGKLGEPEAFVLWRRGHIIHVAGSDEVGAMYGLLELADLVRAQGMARAAGALRQPVVKKPFIAFRATNPFLSLPWRGRTWETWWFRSEDFWRKYLDLLARARFNWVDLHGMYDIRRTNFPNIYPYFVESESFPGCGLPPEEKRKNLAMLNKVCALAQDRGIKIALMSYHASWNVNDLPKARYEQSEENLARYTRECVRNLLKGCPGLGMIGFRIGESGRREDFYEKSYLPGIRETGLNIPLYTRTWGANKPRILEIGREFPDFFIEIKYNGEQFGLPYIVQGGRMAGWGHYSYQNYFSVPTAYRVLWQNRANGTHRIFRWANADYVRRTVRNYPLGGAAGFSLEAINTYYPQRDYYLKYPERHRFFDWVFQRDWAWYALWGRLSYDPDTSLEPVLAEYRRHFGDRAGRAVFDLQQKSSLIVPLIYQIHCLGPDHRNMAPELETGYNLAKFAGIGPLDTHVMQTIGEYVGRTISGRPSPRLTPFEQADLLKAAVSETEQALGRARVLMEPGQKEFDSLAIETSALISLGLYYEQKMRAATHLALFRRTWDESQYAAACRCSHRAVQHWEELAEVTDTMYKPFVDTLRMHTTEFHWKNYVEEVRKDRDDLRAAYGRFQEKLSAGKLFIGHVPVRRRAPGRPVSLGVTVGPQEQVKSVTCCVEVGGQERRIRAVREAGTRFRAEPEVRPGWRKPAYHWEVVGTNGERLRYPQEGAIELRLTADERGPTLARPSVRVEQLSPGRKRVTVRVRVQDGSGVQSVSLLHKPFPSEARWRAKAMRLEGGRYAASFKVTAAGAMWSLEALDRCGNGTMWPDFREADPYVQVPPWDAPVEEVPEYGRPANLSKKDLSPERYAAMIAGRIAQGLERAKPEDHVAVLQAVKQGLSLVIFNQNFPEQWQGKWLPPGVEYTDPDFGECRVLREHPIFPGGPAKIAFQKCVNDALRVTGGGWEALTEPCGIAVLAYGKGHIVLVQMRILETIDSDGRRGKPFLLLDPGNGVVLSALDTLGVEYVELTEAAKRKK